MATSLIIKDGIGAVKSLAVNSGSEGFVPIHNISGSVNVTASSANPIAITGSVSVLQPVSVDVVVGDNIFVTSSLASPLYISSSTNSPILITGTVATTTGYSVDYPTWVTGAVTVSQPVSVDIVSGNSLFVTSSIAAPLYISSSDNSPILITGTVATTTGYSVDFPTWITGTVHTDNTTTITDGLRVTSSVEYPLWVSASLANPVAVTGSFTTTVVDGLRVTGTFSDPVAVTGTVSVGAGVSNYGGTNALAVSIFGRGTASDSPVWITGTVSPTVTASVYVTASVSVPAAVEFSASLQRDISGSTANQYLQVGIVSMATSSARRTYALASWYGPNYTSMADVFDWSTAASGSVCLASASVNRKSLVISNPTPLDLYISIGCPSGLESTNGLYISNTSSAPYGQTFTLYASGTYFAEPHNINMFHGGYIVSSSIDPKQPRIFVTDTY